MHPLLATRQLDDGRVLEARLLARITVYGLTFATPIRGDDDARDLVATWVTTVTVAG